MNKKKQKIKIVPIVIVLSITAIIVGIIISNINKNLKEEGIEIIDATFMCDNNLEKFYEDDKYTYYFPCTKSTSIYIKYPNGNKILVVSALQEEKVTIEELLKADLEVVKKEK